MEVVVVVKFRHKKDGFGFKTMIKWWFILCYVFTPGFFTIVIWEAFTDLPHYVTVIRVVLVFIYVSLLLLVSVDWPIYLSFAASAQQSLSSISDGLDDDDTDGDDDLKELVRLAGTRGGSDSNSKSSVELVSRTESHPMTAPERTEKAPVAVYSSKTLSLTIEDIVLDPLYSPQFKSFARHLIGEFNVEGLLFFFRVRKFQKYVSSRIRARSQESTPSVIADSNENESRLPSNDVEGSV